MSAPNGLVSLHIFLRFTDQLLLRRHISFVPSVGDLVVHNDGRYRVEAVEWCLDSGSATLAEARVNVEVTPVFTAAPAKKPAAKRKPK